MISRAQMIWLAALIFGDALTGAVCYQFLPQRSPIHWNIHGQVDGYGSPWQLAFVMPIVAVGIAGLLIGLARTPPIRDGLQRSGTIYGLMVIAGVGMIVLIHALMLLGALGKPIDVSRGIMVAVGLLFAILGNWMGKLRRNWIAGIRTPWTLKNDVVWERTHRIGGRLMVALGLTVLLAALVFPFWAATAVFVGSLLGFALWSFVYSWRIYQEVGGDKRLA
jgi:uncharacterized membrane protein